MKRVVDFLPADAVAYLRMAEGDVRFPVRPVPAGDFLIGSGTDCDLRLGDGVLPPLHSVLRASPKSASWTRLVRSPELFVNGEAVRQAQLHDGDLIEIGAFRMVFRFATEQAEACLHDLLTSSEDQTEPIVMQPRQLVDVLEKELDLLAAWDRTAQSGLQELLSAVNSLSRHLHQTPNAQPASLLSESQEPAAAENELTRLLHCQTERIELLHEVMGNVIQQQRLMADVLLGLADRIAQLTGSEITRRRAS